MSSSQSQTARWSVVQACDDKQPESDKYHWIEIELLHEDDGTPVPSEEYCITLPDGTQVRGWLNERGWARVDFFRDPGNCQITFPQRDANTWQALG